MSEFKGTKGPWAVSDGWVDRHVGIDAESHGAIALVLSAMEDDYTCSDIKRDTKRTELSANAKLIAAAPELLEALQFCLGRVDLEIDRDAHVIAAKAISKALGESAA